MENPDESGAAASDFDIGGGLRLTVQVILTPAALSRIQKTGEWRGNLATIITSDHARTSKPTTTRFYGGVVSDDVKALVEAWNAEAGHGAWMFSNRNQVLKLEEISAKTYNVIVVSLEVFSVSDLISKIKCYFRKCNEGSHLVDGRNYAYGSLETFLVKLQEAYQKRAQLWWFDDDDSVRMSDESPDLTKALMDAFARRFMSQPKYEAATTPAVYAAFVNGVNIIKRIQKTKPIKFSDGIGIVLDCLAATFPGTIYPSHLNNGNFMNIAIPQHVKRIF